jgi:SAM-dependent methyltransferase
MTTSYYSEHFYREHAQQYAYVAKEFLQSVYVKSSHPGLKNDWDAWERLKQLAPGKRGLDAGCGAGARDVFHLWSEGYDMVGVDAVEENIQVAQEMHPEIADRVFVSDMRQPHPFEDQSFDFVACNAVVQHIEPELVRDVVLPELARVLRVGGVLQLMVKNGTGIITVFDKDYGVDRTFHLYDEHEMLGILQGQGMALIESQSLEELGGFLYFTDPKQVDHGLFFARKG